MGISGEQISALGIEGVESADVAEKMTSIYANLSAAVPPKPGVAPAPVFGL